MSFAAAVMMLIAWSAIIGLCVYCFYRIFTENKK